MTGTFQVMLVVKNLPSKQQMHVWSLGWEYPLEKEMVTHSSILVWKYHGQRSLEGYNPWGYERAGHDLMTKQQND